MQVQDFGPEHATATANFVAASTVDAGNELDESASKFSDFGDSVAAQVQDFGPAHATATAKFLAASTAEGGNECGGSGSEFSEFSDVAYSGSSVEWTEESS